GAHPRRRVDQRGRAAGHDGSPLGGAGRGALAILLLSNVLSNGASLRPFAPELVLSLGILVVLLVGLVARAASRALLLGLTVATLMATATALLTAYLSLEFISILSYVLAAFSPRRARSAEAGLKYAIYGGVATGAMLYGFSLLYGLAASTGLDDVRVALAAAP